MSSSSSNLSISSRCSIMRRSISSCKRKQDHGVVCVFFCIFLMATLLTVSASGDITEKEIVSYVMEPFDLPTTSMNNDWRVTDPAWFTRRFNDAGSLTLTPTSTTSSSSSSSSFMFGTGALQIDYTVVATESWGGFVDFGYVLNGTTTTTKEGNVDDAANKEDDGGSSSSVLKGPFRHNCYGASYISLWYKILKPQNATGRAHLRLVLYDDSHCSSSSSTLNNNEDCGNPDGLEVEQYFSFHNILDGKTEGEEDEWTELRVDLKGSGNSNDPFWLTGWVGSEGNGILDLNRLRGWRIEISIDAGGDGVGSATSGSFVLDQLACVGGGELLGAALYHSTDGQQEVLDEEETVDAEASFDQAVIDGVWSEDYFGSDVSQSLTTTALSSSSSSSSSGRLDVIYAIHQTQVWGGYLSFTHQAPGNAYYNLSQATDILLDYDIVQPASTPGRGHVRFLLHDVAGKECMDGDDLDCSDGGGMTTTTTSSLQDQEWYYSFHYILDGDITKEDDAGITAGNVSIPLQGNADPASPFWLTGWSGATDGNSVLDTAWIKGFTLELTIDGEGSLGSMLSGEVIFDNLRAFSSVAMPTEGGGEPKDNTEDTTDDDDDETPEIISNVGYTISTENEVSYVMEPFSSSSAWYTRLYGDEGKLNLTQTTEAEALFGDSALRVEYTVVVTEDWGGFVDFGWIQAKTPHNCDGATHLSLWYKVAERQSNPGRVHMRVVLMDDSDCDLAEDIDLEDGLNVPSCSDDHGLNLEHYFSFHYVLDGVDAEDEDGDDWKELRVDLMGDGDPASPFWLTGWAGTGGNGQLDIHKLRGWRIELSMDAEEGMGSSSSGTILFDQLACVGGGDMLGAAFRLGQDTTFQDAVQDGTWYDEYYESEISTNFTNLTMTPGHLELEYVIQHTQGWGGFLAVTHMAPGAAYYNLSQASDVYLDYEVVRESSVPGRAHIRLILQDGSHCEQNCDISSLPHERYYSFHYMLDGVPAGEETDDPGRGSILIPLEGSREPSTPFWLTGWSGILGNEIFDTSYIKGFTIELNVDSQGDIGSTVTGDVVLGNMAAVSRIIDNSTDPNAALLAAKCVVEPDLYFDLQSPLFQRKEFLGRRCCETCDADPECLYALSDGRDCYLASYLEPDAVGLLNTGARRAVISAFWMNDATKRGDFCDKCDCREQDLTIDCRGRDLAAVPKTFFGFTGNNSTDDPDMVVPWTPRVLDLSDNPRIVILGTDALEAIAETLEELILSQNIKHISLASLSSLPGLTSIIFSKLNEDGSGGGLIGSDSEGNFLKNVIASPDGMFADICCGRGPQVELSGLTFCDMQVDSPGVDAVYEPFVQYIGAKTSETLTPSSTFMSEAAESAEKCAAYCALSSNCQFFTYDARLPNAEHACNLLENNGTSAETVCCADDHYADELGTLPGFISGRTPQARHQWDNAVVQVSVSSLVLDQANKYKTQFELSLGSTPLRGGVWIEPTLAASTTKLDVSIRPARVVLYDANMTVTVTVEVLSKVDESATSVTLIVNNVVDSCDAAFTSTGSNKNAVYIELKVPTLSFAQANKAATIAFPVGAVLFALALFIYFKHKQKSNDSVWRVNKKELHFADPPQIVGSGTFGLVLLAEYRGTQVAVKRVIPPKAQVKKSSVFGSMMPKRLNLDTMESQSVLPSNETDAGTDATKELSSRPPNSVKFGSDVKLGAEGSIGGSGIMRGGFIGRSGSDSMISAVSKSGGVKSMSDALSWRKLKKDFVSEMRYLSKLRHPCITTVMGAVIGSGEEPMLIMEYMDHGSLYDLLHNETMMLDGEVLLPILRDISQGCRFLHATQPQVIHGDLKAANILVDSKFRAKVADFGLSQKRHIGATGTPYWMAPELLRGESTNNAMSDVYAFGIILYEVYSRRDPYEGEDPNDVLRQVADKNVHKRPPVPPACPAQVQSLMSDCLVEDPGERPTFEELDKRLKRVDAEDVETKNGKNLQKTTISLFDIFPRHIAEALRDGRKVEPEHRDVVTIFFSDIVGFTDISSSLAPQKVANMLDRLYNAFDDLSHTHDVFKVETIGDAWMGVTNLTHDQPDNHVKLIALFAIDAIRVANTIAVDVDDPEKGFVNLRVGFHSGPVVADVVGSRNPRYCLFGDTVNTASRMESNSGVNRINCSERSAELLQEQLPGVRLTPRGAIKIKGKGDMKTFWVHRKQSCLSPRAAQGVDMTGTIRKAEYETPSENFEVEPDASKIQTSTEAPQEQAPPTMQPIVTTNEMLKEEKLVDAMPPTVQPIVTSKDMLKEEKVVDAMTESSTSSTPETASTPDANGGSDTSGSVQEV